METATDKHTKGQTYRQTQSTVDNNDTQLGEEINKKAEDFHEAGGFHLEL